MATIQACAIAGYLTAVLCSASPKLGAQDSRAPTREAAGSAEPRLRCWRGQPAPACQSFVITEFGFAPAVITTRSGYIREPGTPYEYRGSAKDFSGNVFLEIGRMYNRGPSAAIGATLLLGVNGDGGMVGAKARYRRWLTPAGLSLDVGAGAKVGNLPVVGRTTILTGDLAVNFSDYGALVTGVELARRDGRNRAALFGGARLGSKPGLITTGLAMIIAAIGVVALASWNLE